MANPLDLLAFAKRAWETTNQPLKERASVLPLGQYEDGSVGLAWPGILAAPAEGVANFGTYGYGEDAVPYNSRMAFDAAGGAMTGGLGVGLAGGMADNALGSAGGKLTQSASPALASRDMQQMARSLGYDPQRVRSWASDKINELSRSTWDSDKAEAARLSQLLQELDADPNALAAIRQGERSSALQSQAQRQQNKTERPIANRDGYQIIRRDDPDVGALNFDVLGPDGGSVGSAKMSAAQGQVETPEIGWVGIDEAHQRKGLASWLYDEIERDIGQKLWPSPELISPEIQAFWQKRDPDRLARMLAGTYANAPTGSSVPMAMNALEKAQPQGIRAYHGSPHDFDKFDISKIGTGEGAQAYGHGIYLAGNEATARSYRDTLAGMRGATAGDGADLSQWAQANPGEAFWLGDEIAKAAASVGQSADDPKAMNMIINRIAGLESKTMHPAHDRANFALDEIEAAVPQEIRDYITSKFSPAKGRMYEVNIRADEGDFIDWDRPLSEQPKFAELLKKLAPDVPEDARQYAAHTLYDPQFRQGLRDNGFAGIKYLDAMSRGDGAGSSNYVVFDDALIDILRKYANAPTGAAIPAGMEAAQGAQDTDPALLQVLRQYGMI